MHVSGGYLVQQVLNGLIVGSFYSLLAVAYALVHAITNRVILSFGDFMTFGAFYAIMAVLVAAGFRLVRHGRPGHCLPGGGVRHGARSGSPPIAWPLPG